MENYNDWVLDEPFSEHKETSLYDFAPPSDLH